MDNVWIVYIVSTEMGDFAFDQDFNPLLGEEYDPSIVITFQQETLAPADDWEEWNLNYSNEDMIQLLPRLIKSKMKRMVAEWDGPSH